MMDPRIVGRRAFFGSFASAVAIPVAAQPKIAAPDERCRACGVENQFDHLGLAVSGRDDGSLRRVVITDWIVQRCQNCGTLRGLPA